jgi:ADP-heptose:LPS heptosyltransferase
VTPARPLADPDTRRVAVVRLRVGLGDLLASVPALRALRAARPDVEIVMITWPEMAPVVDRMSGYVDELLGFPGYPGIPERPPELDLLPGFLERARSRRFDLAIQMYGGQAPANEVTALLGARRTAGFFTPGDFPADLATHIPYPYRAHEVHRHLQLLRFLGVPPGSDTLEFPLWPVDRVAAAALRAKYDLAPRTYACIHPGATAASRRWVPQRFAAVSDALAERGLRVVLVGVEGEEPVTAAVRSRMRSDAIDLCGRTDLGAFAALLADARLLVGNDSGPAHLAAALGTPSVAVYLAGDPQRWAAFDAGRHRIAQAGVGCQPCPHQRCPIDFRCATGLSTGRVIEEASRLLEVS